MKKFALAAGLILLICLAAGQVWAHKLNLYAYQEGSRIKGEAYFKGGIKVQKGIVKVLTKDGRMRGPDRHRQGRQLQPAHSQAAPALHYHPGKRGRA
jgi:hypothetical protein